MIKSCDQTSFIYQAVVDALATETPLQIVGGASKSFYGRTPQGKILNISAHHGIINYHPSELVITARTGTPLSIIEKTLAEHGQMLAFEPPYFSPSSTLGGVIACGFSGSRRPFTGSVRDFVLGCKMINGKAEVLSFGGEVMKNVAGYDVSRLMVGAMGTLGVLLEVSLKVLPKPVVEKTHVFDLTASEALAQMTELSKKSLPLSGLSYVGRLMYVRLSGTEKTVISASKKIGGDELIGKNNFWQDCNEQRTHFFQDAGDLWRLSVPQATPNLLLSGEWLYEWGGGLRWLKTSEPRWSIFTLAEKMQGHARLFRARDRSAELFQPMPDVLKKLNRSIKTAFDPKGIFNPYRMYRDW
jgi:glycolate oxidase FAD binding subunit